MADEKLFDKIVITDSLSEIASEKMEGYLAHALVLTGAWNLISTESISFSGDMT